MAINDNDGRPAIDNRETGTGGEIHIILKHWFRLPAASVLVRLLQHSENQQNPPYYQVLVMQIR